MMTAGVAKMIFKHGKENTLNGGEIREYCELIIMALDYLAAEEKRYGVKQAHKNVKGVIKNELSSRNGYS